MEGVRLDMTDGYADQCKINLMDTKFEILGSCAALPRLFLDDYENSLWNIITKNFVDRSHSLPWTTLALIFFPNDVTQGSPNFLGGLFK